MTDIGLEEGEVICSKCNGKGDNGNASTCSKCNGKGKLDWVSNAMGQPEPTDPQAFSYISSGGRPAIDFDIGDFIADSSWHDLDLSSIVPAGSTSVYLRTRIKGTTANKRIRLRKNGNLNEVSIKTQAANVDICSDIIVKLDGNRVIEYNLNSLVVSDFYILGWFI